MSDLNYKLPGISMIDMNLQTKLQMAAIMLQHGTDKQKEEAAAFIRDLPVIQNLAPIHQAAVKDKSDDGCIIPDANETNKGKQILQIQQNITCRLESLKQLLISMQADMQFYCPMAGAELRRFIRNIPDIQSIWLTDTRAAISHLESKKE